MNGKTQPERKSLKSKSSRVRDLLAQGTTKTHMTITHTRILVNTPIRLATTNTYLWTWMQPILLPLLRNLPTKSEHSTEPRDDASGVEPKAIWLATARRMPTLRTFRTDKTQTFEKLQLSQLPLPLPQQPRQLRQTFHHLHHPSCPTVMSLLQRIGVSHELGLSCGYDIISSRLFDHIPYDES
jgi:hypothetical protein